MVWGQKHVAMHPGITQTNQEFQIQQLARGSDGDRSDWRRLPNVSWSNGTLGTNNDATIESHDKARIKVHVTTNKITFQTSDYDVPVLHVHGERRHYFNIHIQGWFRWRTRITILHRLRSCGQRRRYLSNSGMVEFLNGNYFHGYSCGQKGLTMNTAESEYIAVVH